MSKRGNTKQLAWRELAWDTTTTPGQVMTALQRLATAPELGTIVVQFEATSIGARWLIGSQAHRLGGLIDTLTAQLPVRVHPLKRQPLKAHLAAKVTSGTKTALSGDANRVSASIRGLFGAVSRLDTGEALILQLILGRRAGPSVWQHADVPSWWQLLTGSSQAPVKSTKDSKDDLHGFDCVIRIGAKGSESRARFLIRQAYGALRTIETPVSRLHLTGEHPDRLNDARLPWRWPTRLRASELAVFTGWPAGEPPLPLIGSLHPRILPPPTKLIPTERTVGVTAAPGTETRIGIPVKDAAFHTHLLGPTGAGKSTVMLSLIQADIESGRGVLVIDPKGDLATDVLARIPANRRGEVVVIDPTSPAPVGFNPLAGPRTSAPVRADTLLSIFEALFKDNWGIRTADTLTASFLTLARVKDANLLWLPALLTDPGFRKRVLKQSGGDPLGTDNFWRQYDAKRPETQATEIGPVLNKLRQLVLRPGLRAILGQSKPGFDIGDIFTQKRIVIVNLNRGLIGNDAAKLLGTLILGQFWSRLLARQALPVAHRHIVGIYIDEVHDFIAGLPGDLSDALAQARSLGGAFTIAHQYRTQLSPPMQQAVDANTRSKIIFGLNGADAAATAKHVPELDAQDFLLLPKYQAYANLMQGGQNTGWMTITTRPPTSPSSDAAEVYAASQAKYGVPSERTEQEILSLITPDIPEDSGPVGRVKR